MKVYEILERKQINEAVPLIAGIGIGTIVSAISIGMAAWSAYDIFNFIKEHGDNPEEITDEQWGELFIDAALLFTPGIAKLGRGMVAKLMPDAAKKWGGNWLKEKLIKQYKEARKKAKADYDKDMRRAGTPEARAAAKKRFDERMAKARAKAETNISRLPRDILNIVNVLFTANFLKEWYQKLEMLNIEYQACIDGDKTTRFGDATPEEAYDLVQEERRKLLGEASAVLLVNLGLGSKAAGLLKWIAGSVGKAAAGSFGKLALSITPAAAQRILKLIEGGPARKLAFLAFVQNPEAQKFMSYVTFGLLDIPTKWIRDMLGLTADIALDGLNKGLEVAGEKLGFTPPQVLPSPTPPGGQVAYDAKQRAAHDLAMQVERDPKNPKILYIDRVAITDAEGYQNVSNATLADIKNRANILGRADPTAGIPKKPGKDYNY